MEIQGKFIRLGNLVEGTSARGAWRKQELIIETIEQYPKQVCLICWGDTIDAIANLEAGQMTHQQITAVASIPMDFFTEQEDDLPF